ncbi:MAG: HD domain-containing protein [Clostridia bacterium]|nr:HD domain-containing protein [Clostridia bacterium]
MGKEANIKRKSTKTPVVLYRLCLKIAFAALIMLCGLTLEKGFIAKDRLYMLSLTFAAIFAVLYQIVYYFYKMSGDDIKYNKNPLNYQIFLMLRILSFFGGVALIMAGANTVNSIGNIGIKLLSSIVIIAGFVLCQLIYNNSNVFSHISTFFSNATVGITIYTTYYAYAHGFNYGFFILAAGALISNLIGEAAFYFYNKNKHKYDDLDKKTQQNIRLMYLARNTLALVIMYIIIVMLILTDSLEVFAQSNLFEYITKLLPILISAVTVSVLLYNNFKKSSQTIKIFAPLKEEHNFVTSLKEKYPSGTLVKSLDYLMDNMNAKKGYKRYSGEDYYYHPLNVVKILMDSGITDEDTLTSALLHDCIEDLPGCDMAKIAGLANGRVADIVDMVSKKKDLDYKEENNMRQYLDNIKTDAQATAVKVADRMHNMSSLNNASEEKRIKKWAETKKFYLPLIEEVSKKYSEYTKLFDDAKRFFEEGGAQYGV